MRNSNSRDKNTSSQTLHNRNAVTQIRKPSNCLENTNLNVAPSSRKSEKRHPLPPKPQSKVSYNVEVNMTESKIFQAKQGLHLLKKKMNRTGMSRQKSRSTSERVDENIPQPLLAKQMTVAESKKQVAFKKTKQPSKYSKQNQLPVLETKTGRQVQPTQGQIVKGASKDYDSKPICKQVDFMDLLERQIKKDELISGKEGPKAKREVNKIYNQNGEEIILHQCTMGCGRMFNPDTIQKHQKICQKVFQSKRKAFDSSQHRQIQGENYPSSFKKVEEKTKPKAQIPKWKLESARLRAGLKLGKKQLLSKEEEKAMQEQVDVLRPCQFCGRKFNEKAAQKHIPFCQRKSKEIGKNGRQR